MVFACVFVRLFSAALFSAISLAVVMEQAPSGFLPSDTKTPEEQSRHWEAGAESRKTDETSDFLLRRGVSAPSLSAGHTFGSLAASALSSKVCIMTCPLMSIRPQLRISEIPLNKVGWLESTPHIARWRRCSEDEAPLA